MGTQWRYLLVAASLTLLAGACTAGPRMGSQALGGPSGAYEDCVPVDSASPDLRVRYARFAVLPGVYEGWLASGCFPPVLEDEELAGTENPVGNLIRLAGSQALIVDVGDAWMTECRERGISLASAGPSIGADILLVKERLSAQPGFASANILELGISLGKTADGDHRFAMYLGGANRAILVSCQRSVDRLIARAVEALRAG